MDGAAGLGLEPFDPVCRPLIRSKGRPAPAAADCYRFARSHPAVEGCMTGPKNLAQRREALRALDLGPLQEAELIRRRRVGDHLRGKT